MSLSFGFGLPRDCRPGQPLFHLQIFFMFWLPGDPASGYKMPDAIGLPRINAAAVHAGIHVQ
jgi:hypothetical protein